VGLLLDQVFVKNLSLGLPGVHEEQEGLDSKLMNEAQKTHANGRDP